MAPRKVKSPLDEAAGHNQKRQRAERQAAQRKEVAVRASYDALVAEQSAPGAAPADTSATLSTTALASDGAILRVPAGGRAELTVTGLQGWHYDAASLSLAPYGRNMALPLTLERNEPGPQEPKKYVAALSLPLTPPLFVGSLIYRYGAAKSRSSSGRSWDDLIVAAEEKDIELTMTLPLANVSMATERSYIGAMVSKLTLNQQLTHDAVPRITAILPNAGDGLSISRDDDRVLHQVPRKLGSDDSAQTADLADYLNEKAEAGEGSATFLIGSRTDCVLSLRLTLTRRRLADGLACSADTGQVILSPWQTLPLFPNLPTGPNVVTSLTAKAAVDGPALAGLKVPATLAACQGIYLPPRVSLLQPFRLPGNGDQARRFSGVWLCLSGPPDSAETLQIDLADFDDDSQSPGTVRAAVKTTVSNRQMDLQPIGDGLFAHWAAFDTAAEIDIPDLDRPFALVLGDASGPVPLLECAAVPGPLSPALSRNLGRSDRWTQRRFGQAAKVLLCELGETTDGIPATITAQSGGATATAALPDGTHDLALTLEGSAQLQLSTTRQTVLTDLQVTSSTSAETLG